MGTSASSQPFSVIAIDRTQRRVVLSLRADMLGTIANHLKACPDGRKAAQSTRRLGFALAAAGDRLFGKDSEHPDLENTQVVG